MVVSVQKSSTSVSIDLETAGVRVNIPRSSYLLQIIDLALQFIAGSHKRSDKLPLYSFESLEEPTPHSTWRRSPSLQSSATSASSSQLLSSRISGTWCASGRSARSTRSSTPPWLQTNMKTSCARKGCTKITSSSFPSSTLIWYACARLALVRSDAENIIWNVVALNGVRRSYSSVFLKTLDIGCTEETTNDCWLPVRTSTDDERNLSATTFQLLRFVFL